MIEKRPKPDLAYILMVILLCFLATVWLISLIHDALTHSLCGYAMLITILGIIGIFIKLLYERLKNKDDDFYDKNVFK